MAGKPKAKPSQNSDDEGSNAIVSDQLLDLMDFLGLDSDLDFAYNLQLEEALAASLASQPSASSSSSIPRPKLHNPEPNPVATIHSRDVSKSHQIYQEWLGTSFEFRRAGEEAEEEEDHGDGLEFLKFSGGGWIDHGPTFPNPFGEGSSKVVENQGVFSLYFKGLVSEEGIRRENRDVVSAIGVAICNPEGSVVFEVKRRFVGTERSKVAAECKALIAGLDAALDLQLKSVCVYCDYYLLFQFVTGKWPAKQRKIAALVSHINDLKGRFDSCLFRHVARHDIKFAFKLAREAIAPQIIQNEEPAPKKKLIETCVICLEDCDVNRMFAVDVCLHRYCFSCMKQHVEVKLLQGLVPKCPHDGCKFDLNVDGCAKFLTPKDLTILRQRIKEASIPISEKVYCPYPRCSALMTKGEVLDYTKDIFVTADQTGVRKCMKCHGLFCINCKVPWHKRVTCNEYKRSSNPPSEDVKLKSMASTFRWRQCVKCNHMIDLAEGCYHMTCRCGHEFCYKCGAEWKNKKATCSCPLWTEDHIWHDNDERDFVVGGRHVFEPHAWHGEEEEEDEDENEDEDEGFYYSHGSNQWQVGSSILV